MRLCFATNNKHKIKEIEALLGSSYQLLSLEDIGCDVELPEDQDTLEGNSLQKAQYVYAHFQVDCFADDTGLEVTALNGAPGVYSARYAGPEKDTTANMALLLKNLGGKSDRSAQFRTVITLILGGRQIQFEGIVKGKIAEHHHGEKGFGYDPIFIPEGYSKTFAEMSQEEKNKISHRGLAIQKLVKYLREEAKA
jgi:XTP/dITP diphosphohydrolase